jgi:LCP family protein required for cell wall assembly
MDGGMKHERKQIKKRTKWKAFMLTFVLLVFATISYAYFQYKDGETQSIKTIEKIAKSPQFIYNFEGKKDAYGDTNILLLGSDAREKENSRSDTIMIASYNENKGTFKLTSIMRDCYVSIPGHGKHKINAAFAYGGPELIRQTLKQNFGVDLQYYAMIDFQGFVQLINEAFPNGVEVNVEKKMSAYVDTPLEPGRQRLNGQQMLSYVRFRHDAVGDFGRVERQQNAMKVIGEQFMGLGTITKLPKLIGVVRPYINTNMKTTDILFMAKDYLTKSNGKVATMRIPVTNSFTEPKMKGEGAVLAIDLEKNRQALNQFISE